MFEQVFAYVIESDIEMAGHGMGGGPPARPVSIACSSKVENNPEPVGSNAANRHFNPATLFYHFPNSLPGP